LKTIKASVKAIADGNYLVTVFAADSGTGEERASYDNLGKVVQGEEAAVKLLAQELNTATGRVANLTMKLPFKDGEKGKGK